MRTRYEDHLKGMRVELGEGYVTAAEYQVIAMYIDGASRSQIAKSLMRSDRTIDSQITQAKARTGARTIYQLIAMTAASDALRERGRSSNEANPAVGGWGSRAAPSRVL